MNTSDLLAALKRPHTGAFETYHVTTLEVVRNTPSGETQTVRVEILDAGPTKPQRYHARARTDDGREVIGGLCATATDALAVLNWKALDNPRPDPSDLPPKTWQSPN